MERIQIKSLEDTKKFAFDFAKNLQAGDVIVLDGDLGAGKTQFVKYIAHALHSEDEVQSPTFPIIIEYEADIPLFHFDLYRLKSANELYNVGFYDYLESDGICFIEWGKKFPENMPKSAIFLTIYRISENEREITINFANN
jgi:tRNA threonylcarbamoyladenosine biosynthesis protein TsaE